MPTEIELKAAVYDRIVLIEQLQKEIAQLNQELINAQNQKSKVKETENAEKAD